MEADTIVIRRATKEDAEAFLALWNRNFRRGHLKLTATLLRDRADVARFRARHSGRNPNEYSFVAFASGTKLVGVCGFSARARGRTRHRGELGWLVDRDYVGRGIATALLGEVLKEAKKRGFKRVEAEIAVGNPVSIRLARRFGFRLEGRRAAGLALDSGRYMDTYLFGKQLK